MFMQENKVSQKLWSGLEATWHSLAHYHQMKPLKQDDCTQTAFCERSLAQVIPQTFPGYYLGEY